MGGCLRFCSCSGGCLPTGKVSATITRLGPDPRTPTPPPRSRAVLPRPPIGNPASVSPYVERFSLRYCSGFTVWKVRGDGCLLLVFRWVFVWFLSGSPLVLLVLVCWFPVGSLVARACLFVSGSFFGWLSARPDRCWMVWMTCSMIGLLAWSAWIVS
jgi:hypothetical protein